MSSGRVAYISISLWLCCFFVQRAIAQSWPNNPGSFLEPNRFAVVSEINDSYLWLEAGFGRDLNSGSVRFGLEGLIWSRLRSLSGFRFPVETADYFFGVYSTFNAFNARHRVRVSHISSHLVDGADTVVGGSSSRFSREFISIERFIYFPRAEVIATIGVRYVFHQVTDVEPSFQIPASLTIPLLTWGSARETKEHPVLAGRFFLTLSADAGPSWPAFSGGVTSRFMFNRTGALDLFARYYHGLSRAGIEGKRQERQVEIGVKVIPFEWFE
jgi:hypothetical protein